MLHHHRTILFAASLFVSSSSLRAQAADPSGHWEGAVRAQGMEVLIQIDLAKNAKGELRGTFDNPARNIKGLPLAAVTIEGRSIRFSPRQDQGFTGVLSDDGKAITGDFVEGDLSAPFTLTRTGDARIDAPARISAIGKDLEGRWDGTLEANGTPMRIVLKLANQPDGTATGDMVNVDQGGVNVPATAIIRKGAGVTIEFKAVGGSYSGDLNAQGTELAGAWTQGPLVLPLTLRRVAVK